MHRAHRFVGVLCATLGAIPLSLGCAGGGDLAGLVDLLGAPGGDARVVAGLKEALSVGTRNAVRQTSRSGGFLDDPRIRIALPGTLDEMAGALRLAGYGAQVDELYVAMNRGAEQAAAEATEVFLTGIRRMTFRDAMGILNGGDTAATEFFERTTRDTLFQRFEPIVAEKLGRVGAVQHYDRLLARYAAIPFVDEPALDLRRYVTDEALDGLFSVLGAEERKIRTDPSARVTPLLREVFGG